MVDNQKLPSKELKNCPFCDGEAKIYHKNRLGIKYIEIGCDNCFYKVLESDWNTRAQSEQLTTTQQALNSAVKALEVARIVNIIIC